MKFLNEIETRPLSAKNLDDTIWGTLITFGVMGGLCAVAMFGLVAV